MAEIRGLAGVITLHANMLATHLISCWMCTTLQRRALPLSEAPGSMLATA